MYNLPVLSEIILLLHWVLVHLSDWFAPLGYRWQWGLAIIGLTIIVRLILFPLTWKQYKSAQQMQMIQPQIKELQKKYKSDRAKLQEETMKLYSEHRVNPFASCLPLVLQLPVFIALYATIAGKGPLSAAAYQPSVQALAHAPFLWISELGKPDPTYILLILYVATQLISTELMLANQSDPTQKWLMRGMPIMFVIFLYKFPAGLFVYWVTTNLWTIGQQLIIRRTMPKPDEIAARTKALPPKKRSRFMEVLMSSQQEAAKQRDVRAGQKGGQVGEAKAGAGSATGKRPAPGQGARKAPPGKGKQRKPGQGDQPAQGGGKPAQGGTRPKGAGGQQGKPRPSGQGKPRPSGDRTSGGSSGGTQGTNSSAGGPAGE